MTTKIERGDLVYVSVKQKYINLFLSEYGDIESTNFYCMVLEVFDQPDSKVKILDVHPFTFFTEGKLYITSDEFFIRKV